MGKLLNIITPLHKKTKRNYLERMLDEKVHCMNKSKEYELDYWDGDRRYGYGGYKYDGRWKVVALSLIKQYNLKEDSKILDIGCGKGHLLFELKKILKNSEIRGIDISKHALKEAPKEISNFLSIGKAQEKTSFPNNYFDLVISLNTFHNLRVNELKTALQEMERVGKQKYLALESYRDEQELFNLQCWALTAESFFDKEEWIWLYNSFGYTGDYEFIYME